MRKSFLTVVFALLMALAGGIGLTQLSGDPQRPASPVAVSVGQGDSQGLGATIASLQATLRRVPGDHGSWAVLGLAYVEQARVTEDSSWYDKAEDAVRRSFELQPEDNFLALATSAATAAAQHDFSTALVKADEALEINDHNLAALSIRIDALTELGRYRDQLAALRTADRRQPSVSVAARYAYAYELRGRLPLAGRILKEAAESATRSDRSYLLTLLADLERRQGHLRSAATHLRQARHEVPDYLPTMVSQARLDVALDRLPQAVDLWRVVVARLPSPENLMELGELYAKVGRPELARAQFRAVEATIKLTAKDGVNADLETAQYEADHGSADRALAAARAEWRRRKSVHVADALAWSLHRAGDQESALRVARRATRLGTRDPIFWVHRGTIEAALGMEKAARLHLRRGLSLDPGFNPWQSDRARRLLKALEVR